jgi:acetyl esterase/lipase
MPEAAAPPPMRLWEGQAPNQKGDGPDDIPTLQIIRPEKDPDGSAIIVCPGGGYTHLAPHEGEPVARHLNQTGVTGFVLRYRRAPYKHPTPLLDAARAIRTVRARAKEWQLDPTRIGILGFSAGGHLAATISTKFDDGDATAADPIDRVSSRPDVSVLCYPVITFTEVSAHTGSRKNLLGENPPAELVEQLSAERHVTPRTPPTFLFHTMADPGVPVENSLLYAAALRANKIPYAMHIYEQGRHGVGLAENDPVLRTWPTLLSNWLATHHFGWAGKPTTKPQ